MWRGRIKLFCYCNFQVIRKAWVWGLASWSCSITASSHRVYLHPASCLVPPCVFTSSWLPRPTMCIYIQLAASSHHVYLHPASCCQISPDNQANTNRNSERWIREISSFLGPHTQLFDTSILLTSQSQKLDREGPGNNMGSATCSIQQLARELPNWEEICTWTIVFTCKSKNQESSMQPLVNFEQAQFDPHRILSPQGGNIEGLVMRGAPGELLWVEFHELVIVDPVLSSQRGNVQHVKHPCSEPGGQVIVISYRLYCLMI